MIAPPEKTPPRGQAPRHAYVRDASNLWADIPAFTAFAHEVEQAMVGPDLSYPERVRLIKRAAHFGIRRFDANLIIAMVQNRANPHYSGQEPAKRTRWIAYGLIAIAVQAAILLLGWLALSPVFH